MPDNHIARSRIFMAWVLPMLLISVTASARIESLNWGHSKTQQQEVSGFRIYQKTPGTSWGTPLDVEVDSPMIATAQAGVYSIDFEVDEGATVIFAITALNAFGESYLSAESLREPETVPASPEPDPTPEPTPEPAPEPAPEPTPEPAPEPTPEPAPSNLVGSDLSSSDDFNGGGADTQRWMDTQANNSMIEDPALFSRGTLGDNGVLTSSSGLTNIHSHLHPNDSTAWLDYEYRGRMRTDSSNGGIGITSYSNYPASDHYYRIRAQSGQTFKISSHPDRAFTMTCTSTDTGVWLTAGTWFHFAMRTETTSDRTNIKAKVWSSGSDEPASWQIDCDHTGTDQLTHGTVGVWSMGSGTKYWDDFVFQSLNTTVEPEPEPVPASPPPAPVLLP